MKANKENQKPHGFCVTPDSKCTMNYCDDNGCNDRKRDLAPGYEVKTDLEKHLAITLTLIQKERDSMQSRIRGLQQQIATEINVRDGMIEMYNFVLQENTQLREKIKHLEQLKKENEFLVEWNDDKNKVDTIETLKNSLSIERLIVKIKNAQLELKQKEIDRLKDDLFTVADPDHPDYKSIKERYST